MVECKATGSSEYLSQLMVQKRQRTSRCYFKCGVTIRCSSQISPNAQFLFSRHSLGLFHLMVSLISYSFHPDLGINRKPDTSLQYPILTGGTLLFDSSERGECDVVVVVVVVVVLKVLRQAGPRKARLRYR